MRYQWKKLNNQQKGTYGEYFAKMEFTMFGFEVYTAEVDDRGIDFIARKGGQFFEVQVKTITNENQQFITESKLKSSASFLVVLVRLVEGESPTISVFSGDMWCSEDGLLIYKSYEGLKSAPEYRIQLTKRRVPLLEKYSFEKFAATIH
ncbi:hypothetical protein AB4559_06235 [Vibrio sp. 10N.222.51.C8]|uniref:hypothetical protein n=1 Tax=unclassified Vibrio TaxID=2614977 RepID=UPI000C83114A|nr:hypothetical protein [Vibrio sp. 10N.261.51.A7]PML74499.1 hypothetical protein BCT71_06005 [Vibrio sp. 10N.261.51.A7]